MQKVYEVSWTIKLTRAVVANSKEEALEISEDMGSGGDEAAYDVTPMRAKRARGWEGILTCTECGRSNLNESQTMCFDCAASDYLTASRNSS